MVALITEPEEPVPLFHPRDRWQKASLTPSTSEIKQGDLALDVERFLIQQCIIFKG